jgi:hypothetical protein
MVPRNIRLFTPRDFDYSPYFDIIKCPHIDFVKHASYRDLPWDRQGRVCNGDGDCYVPTMQPESQAVIDRLRQDHRDETRKHGLPRREVQKTS